MAVFLAAGVQYKGQFLGSKVEQDHPTTPKQGLRRSYVWVFGLYSRALGGGLGRVWGFGCQASDVGSRVRLPCTVASLSTKEFLCRA